jgi:predicted aldo/keto reductase-like oxidoreductase
MKKLSRRDLLAGTGAGAALATAVIPGSALATGDTPVTMPTRRLGKTGKQIPVLLFGAAVDLDARFDPKLAEAVRHGVTYIDTADCYGNGNSEVAVGSFLEKSGARDQLWITSKSDAHDPAGFEATLNQSLSRLKTDRVDMYYLHALKDPNVFTPELQATVERLKAEGKFLHFGFSCHGSNVPELLNKAAQTPWVEAVMFRYNFRKYGDKELNAAMDAAHAADVGLIAMKTQGSEASFAEAWMKWQQTGKWSKYQAVIKAVLEDKRITAAVSHMKNLDHLAENVGAAVDTSELGMLDRMELRRYAAATREHACDGCEHLCNAAVDAPVRIGTTLRALMYHDAYGEPHRARESFGKLPPEARDFAHVDFEPARAACPHGVDVVALMDRASKILT